MAWANKKTMKKEGCFVEDKASFRCHKEKESKKEKEYLLNENL